MIAPDATIIRTLRMTTATSDRLAARLQTERALQAASLHPSGLPRDAILFVRHIAARPVSAPGWEQAVHARLDQLARQAARPIEGAVPTNAEAVIFADRSELLTCLAVDWCAGAVLAQWWWQSLLRHGDVTRAVIDAWLEMPEHIPVALHRLAARRQAISFAQHVSDDHARWLLKALMQTFGLFELAAALEDVMDHPSEGLEVVKKHTGDTMRATSINGVPSVPWQPWIQTHTLEHLPLDRQVLLGVGLMLHHAPSVVRREAFAREVRAWHAAIRMAQLQQRAPEGPTSTPVQTTSLPGTAESSSTQQIEDAPGTRPARLPEEPRAKHSATSHPSAVSEASTALGHEPIAAVLATAQPVEGQNVLERARLEIETEFGGVCYFINLGLFLNLYSDFTTPLQPGIDLPIWDFVALVAQELIGDEVTQDPIWPFLAQLADRAEDEPPGAHFDPPEHVLLRVWLDELLSIVHPRLQLALGVSAEELPRYFQQRAHLVVSAVCFDVYFALADLPIEIRLSGLDRDPGWVPAAGRTIRFHYD